MKKLYSISVLTFLISLLAFAATSQQVAQILSANTGLRFEENKGQVANMEGEVQTDILFMMKDKGMNVYFRKDGLSYQWFYVEELMDGPFRISEATGRPMHEDDENGMPRAKQPKSNMLHTYRVDMKWLNANPEVHVISEQGYDDYTNYYHAHCPDGVTNVRSYSKLTYKNMYPGIDIVYYEKDGHLKYDIHVAAGADLSKVKFAYSWANPTLEGGSLKLHTPLGWLEEQQPVSWDEDGQPVNINYNVRAGKVGFKGQTSGKALTIDPGVIWATYYGGSEPDAAGTTAVDGSGNVYLSGGSSSTSQIASGGHQNTNNGGQADAFLVKFSSNGARIWATYYGGTGDEGYPSCSVDGSNNVFLAGTTTSTSGIASGGHQNSNNGGVADAFLVKFNANGVRQWATYYGGTGEEQYIDCAADGSGNVFLGGTTSSTASIASGGHQNTFGGSGTDGFVVKFNSAGTLQWGTYYGGASNDEGHAITTDGSGNVYLAGWTGSSNMASGGHQNTLGGSIDAMLVKFSSTGTRLWATYYGGNSQDAAYNTATDGSGNVYLSGWTKSTGGIATTGAYQTSYGGGSEDAFLVKFNSSGTRQWATYFGGPGTDHGLGLSADGSGNIFMSGLTKSESGVAYCGYQTIYGGGISDTFVVKFSTTGSRQWATYYGGDGEDRTRDCATDGFGNVYVNSFTSSTSKMSTQNGHQSAYGGGTADAALAKFIGSDATAPQVTGNTTPVSVAPGAAVDVSVSVVDAETGISSATISYGKATSSTFDVTDASMDKGSGDTWTFTIPSSSQSELGVRYRITAINAACLSTNTSVQHVKIDHSSPGLTIPYNAAGSAQTNYRIISVPLNLSNKTVNAVLGDNLGDYGDKNKWRLWSYNSGTGNYQEAGGSTSIDNGRGYWLIAAENKTLDTGPGQTLGSSDDPIRINVSQDWNLIGNPYPFNILWSDVTSANGSLGLGPVYTYTGAGSYTNPSILKAFEGGFVKANVAGQLTIPGIKNPSAGGRTRSDAEQLRFNSIDGDDWEVRFNLKSGAIISTLSGLGMHPDADPYFDAFDGFNPPRFIEHLELNHHKKLRSWAFSRDIVPPAASHEWGFTIESSTDEDIMIAWENQHLKGSAKQLILRVDNMNLPISMAVTNSFTFRGPQTFTVFYGDVNYIREAVGHFGLVMLEPYPNPTSGQFEVDIAVPEGIKEEISLDLVDAMGREVKSIMRKKYQPGHHHLSFTLADQVTPSPGMYLLRLRGGNQTQYQKVIIK